MLRFIGVTILIASSAWAAGGIPEPPLVIYGQVFSKSDNSLVSITSAAVGISDGQGRTVALNNATTPPIQIVSVNGIGYYLARVPFDTRQVGSTTLTAPANPSLPLALTSGVTYTRSAVINGQPATFADPAQATFTYTAADLGRIEQVDLFINTTGQPNDGYLDWARLHFGNASDPRAARTADADGDGVPNEQEFAAGTDPLDPRSALKVLSVIPSTGNTLIVKWASVPGRTYTIEKSPDLRTWTSVVPAVTAGTTTATFTDTIPNNVPKTFYRVRVQP